MTNDEIVQRLWNLCDVLRDDGVSYSDYVTELTWLLFLKMEQEKACGNTRIRRLLPVGARWSDLVEADVNNVISTYQRMLVTLGQSNKSLIRAIYADARTNIKDGRHLQQLIKAFDLNDWFHVSSDGLGDIYEGLLEKNASDTKSGAGQYFTPRPLIDSIVRIIKPRAGEIIQDPAAGTAGFLTAANRYVREQTMDLSSLSPAERAFQRKRAFIGMELVPNTRRLALMNCVLHDLDGDEFGPIVLGNTLGPEGAALPRSDIMLSNPPFGTARGGGGPTRTDLPFKTQNKQLAFLQHIYLGLRPGGRAAVVVPDNVLFESGVGRDVRRDLMHKCNLHTVLRLPSGIFYAQGVKTNVLFFSKGKVEISTDDPGLTHGVWFYDMRANMPSFGKKTRFEENILKDFESAFGDDPNGGSKREDKGPTGRFRLFSREHIASQRDDSLDISWLKSSSHVDINNLRPPQELAAQAMGDLTEALRELNEIMVQLGAIDEADSQLNLMAEALGIPEPRSNGNVK